MCPSLSAAPVTVQHTQFLGLCLGKGHKAVILTLRFILHGDRGHFPAKMVLILPVLKNFPGDYQPGEVIGGGGGVGGRAGKDPSLKTHTQNPEVRADRNLRGASHTLVHESTM